MLCFPLPAFIVAIQKAGEYKVQYSDFLCEMHELQRKWGTFYLYGIDKKAITSKKRGNVVGAWLQLQGFQSQLSTLVFIKHGLLEYLPAQELVQ